jgi:ribosomal protein L31E
MILAVKVLKNHLRKLHLEKMILAVKVLKNHLRKKLSLETHNLKINNNLESPIF